MNAIWIAVAAVSLLALAFGAILGYASRRFAVEDDPVVEKIDEILPQSQCGQCGYPMTGRTGFSWNPTMAVPCRWTTRPGRAGAKI